MTALHPKQEKKAQMINEKVSGWLGKGIEVKKIQNAIWNNWGVTSEVKNGQLIMALAANKKSTRGGYEFGRSVIIGTFAV
jgi:hypothetical protein